MQSTCIDWASARAIRAEWEDCLKNWREHLKKHVLPRAEGLLRDAGIVPLRVDVDYLNCVINVTLPEEVEVENEDALDRAFHKETGIPLLFEYPRAFRFSLHLTGPLGPIAVPRLSSGVLELSFQAEDLEQLRNAYRQIEARCEAADYVATFATGGIPGLIYITNRVRLCREGDTSGQIQIELLKAAQAKFHLFPGLSWDGAASTEAYGRWLGALPEGSRVVAFDTTFTGGAIDGVRKETAAALSLRSAAISVDVVGVLDLSRVQDPPQDDERTIRGATEQVSVVSTRFIRVPRIITEDVNQLIGYDGLRKCLGLRGHWTAAAIDVRRGQDMLHWVGTPNIAHEMDALVDRNWSCAPLDPEVGRLGAAISFRTVLQNAFERETTEADRARERKLLTDEEYIQEIQVAQKRLNGAKKRFARQLKWG